MVGRTEVRGAEGFAELPAVGTWVCRPRIDRKIAVVALSGVVRLCYLTLTLRVERVYSFCYGRRAMADQPIQNTATQSDKPAAAEAKKDYRRPSLTKLGSLASLTMTLTGGGAADGRPARGTKRGGDFETADCER